MDGSPEKGHLLKVLGKLGELIKKKNHLNLLITITKHYQLAFHENKGRDPNSSS